MAENKKAATPHVTMTVGMNANNRNLTQGLRMGRRPPKRRDLADIAGSWKTDTAIESALVDQDRIEVARRR